jgi:hypothetical protein
MRLHGIDLFPACRILASLAAVTALTSGCNDKSGGAPADSGTDGTVDAGVDSGACVAFDAASLDDAEVALGLSIVTQLQCQKCHGTQLAGNNDGVASPNTVGGLAYPANLTNDPQTGLGCWTQAQIEDAFLNGIDNEGSPLCPPMPHFADAGLTRAMADAVVAFLRSLPPVEANVPNTPDCTLGAPDAGDDGSPTLEDAGADVSATDASDASAADASEAAAADAGDAAAADGGDDGADAPGDDSAMQQEVSE